MFAVVVNTDWQQWSDHQRFDAAEIGSMSAASRNHIRGLRALLCLYSKRVRLHAHQRRHPQQKISWWFRRHPSGRARRGSCVTPTPSGLFSPTSPRRGIGALLHHRRRLTGRREARRCNVQWRDLPRVANSRGAKKMRITRWMRVLVSFAVVVPLAAQAAERTIEGVWRTAVTPLNCQTGEPVGVAPFPRSLHISRRRNNVRVWHRPRLKPSVAQSWPRSVATRTRLARLFVHVHVLPLRLERWFHWIAESDLAAGTRCKRRRLCDEIASRNSWCQ